MLGIQESRKNLDCAVILVIAFQSSRSTMDLHLYLMEVFSHLPPSRNLLGEVGLFDPLGLAFCQKRGSLNHRPFV